MKTTPVKFHNWNCVAVLDKYASNQSPAIQLYDAETREPICRATVNLEHSLPQGCVAIKDYSENAGIEAALKRAGIIEQEPVGAAICEF
jgi:hypothetical protein